MSKKIKIIIALILFLSSFFVTCFFIIKTALKNSNVPDEANNFTINAEPISNEVTNLNPDIVYHAINEQELSQSITIKFSYFYDQNNLIHCLYHPEYKQDILQFLFLQEIIRTFPQWETNKFVFVFNSAKTVVLIKYFVNDNSVPYLIWRLEIVGKI